MWDPTRHPAGQQSRAKKSWKLSPFPLISHLWGLVSSCFVYMCWSSFVGSLLIFGNCFPPRTQHINPFNSSHPSSSIIIHHHPCHPSILWASSISTGAVRRATAVTAWPWHLVMLQSLLFEQLPLHLSLITALLHLVREKIHVGIEWRTQGLIFWTISSGCPTKTDWTNKKHQL